MVLEGTADLDCRLCHGRGTVNTYVSDNWGHYIWDDCSCVILPTEDEILEQKLLEMLVERNKAFIINNLARLTSAS